MRNLALVGESRREIELPELAPPGPNGRHAVDIFQTVSDGFSDGSSSFVLTNDGFLLKVHNNNNKDSSNNNNKPEWIAPLDQLCENPGGEWFDLSYVDSGNELLLVCLSHNGAIVTVDPTSGQAELVGEFEHGLQTGAFSPDGELLCLLTFSEPEEEETTKRNSALLLMNAQWDVLAEVNIPAHIPSEQEKSADSKVSMCWRPDGAYVALSTVDMSDSMRKVRIYKRDNLQFHGIGQMEDGSGKLVPNMMASAGIGWAGAGCSQLLAAAQRKGKKGIQIIFFEPNGNRHREFLLREKNAATTHVRGLAWNVESDMLAVSLREEGGVDKVQVWHRSNYHWYLKQEIRHDNKVAKVMFHQEKPNLLLVLFQDSLKYHEYEFLWHPSNVQIMAPNTCMAHVVDGAALHMTALDRAIVPPPMSAFHVVMDSPICQLLFSKDATHPVSSVVCLSDGSVVLLGNPLTTINGRTRYTAPAVVAKASLRDLQGVDWTTLRSFAMVQQTSTSITLLAVACAPANETAESLRSLTINWTTEGENTTASLSLSDNVIALDQRVLSMAPWVDSPTGALLELEDGKLFEFEVESGQLNPIVGQEFMEPCSWIAGLKDTALLTGGLGEEETMPLVFGLSSRSRLFYHDLLLADAVSSFFVSATHQYLAFVAADGPRSQLRFLPLKDLQKFDSLMGSDQNIVLGYEPRSVERGARLVAILPGSPMAVLQMPRGNLEGIYPRALILRYVMEKISKSCYGEAFSMMRRQKVNLNLIVDLNPRKFLDEDLSLFLTQVKVIDHLNLFISCLQNWDSTQAQYIIPPWLDVLPQNDAEAKTSFEFANKVNQVCSKLRALMLKAEQDGELEGGKKIEDGHFLLPVLTTFARETPPKLEEALTLIKENAIAKSKQQAIPSKKPPLFSDVAQSSIQYLAFLADHELIFNVGLGLYDFDVARACARNSQMDPKVYLPLLKRLRSLPEYYARYEVDMRLKRYEKALQNVFESGLRSECLDGIEPTQINKSDEALPVGNEFENCMSLISAHNLHSVGLTLFDNDEAKKRLIMSSLGDNLLAEGKAASALTVFLATVPVDIERAKRAARAAKNWRCFFTLAFEQNGQSDEAAEQERKTAASEIASGIALASENQYGCRFDFGDAARILLDYGGDLDGALELWIQGWSWSEGCRVATLHGRSDLFERCVEAAVAFVQTAKEDLDERKASYLTANLRYGEVLELRKDAVRSGENDEAQMPDHQDTGSVFSVASNVSNLSMHSTSSTGSLSSVISIKSANSFSISGREEDTRHKSKFNAMGGKSQKKKKKKKKKPCKNRIQPGSAEELKSLVDTMRSSCVDDEFAAVIYSTIEFLAQTGRSFESARELYRCYLDFSDRIQQTHVERANAPRDVNKIPVSLPCEEAVAGLGCPKLAATLHDVFTML
ncbi:Elongator complex protein 1 [Seminavis robusta]|uniref:Elongator complex protein 1 n=1 Tax=Seminavis robusta TaxID=568900 RepID=A0A9N8DAI0_9STRA|nr:Elongator complex protein 1 [Seminavis robusta]|eukprot:Sro11_g009000.1 Elongator complex protein 1 (1414) ;mRNA; r:217210-221572